MFFSHPTYNKQECFLKQVLTSSWEQPEQRHVSTLLGQINCAYWWSDMKWEKTLIRWTRESGQLNQEFTCSATENFWTFERKLEVKAESFRNPKTYYLKHGKEVIEKKNINKAYHLGQ